MHTGSSHTRFFRKQSNLEHTVEACWASWMTLCPSHFKCKGRYHHLVLLECYCHSTYDNYYNNSYYYQHYDQRNSVRGTAGSLLEVGRLWIHECRGLTVTVKQLQPVMNPVIGLFSAGLLNTHTRTETHTRSQTHEHTHIRQTHLFKEYVCRPEEFFRQNYWILHANSWFISLTDTQDGSFQSEIFIFL